MLLVELHLGDVEGSAELGGSVGEILLFQLAAQIFPPRGAVGGHQVQFRQGLLTVEMLAYKFVCLIDGSRTQRKRDDLID